MVLLPPPLLLPLESPLCPSEISRGASNWSLASLKVVETLKQGKGATLRRCKLLKTDAEVVVIVKSLPVTAAASSSSSSDPPPPHLAAALCEASAHAAAFSLAPDAVLPLYAAFFEGRRGAESSSSGGNRFLSSFSSSSSSSLHLVLASAAGTARDAAAGSGGFLLEEHAASAALSALRGCAALHSMGLVHGDVKPENLLILPRLQEGRSREERRRGGDEEEVSSSSFSSVAASSSSTAGPPLLPFSFALSDFGSACPIGGPFPPGTLDFLPPEAAFGSPSFVGGSSGGGLSGSGGGGNGGGGTLLPSSPWPLPSPAASAAAAAAAASAAADVWAIGAATVDLLTGSPPFPAKGAGAGAAVSLLAAATSEPLRLPRHLSAAARSFCELCLRKMPEERPSCVELCGHEWFAGSSR